METPQFIKDVLPQAGQELFNDIYTQEYSKEQSEAMAMAIAWDVVKTKFKPVDNMLVANDEDFIAPRLYTFDLMPTGTVLITNGEDGELMLDAVLADTSKNNDGDYFAEEDLQLLAEQINSDGSTLPAFTHDELRQVAIKLGTQDADKILEELKRQRGMFKQIKAVVDKGKLWIRGLFDKRYKNHIPKGISIEALARNYSDSEKRLKNPKYLGFILTDKPQLRNAGIAV